MESIRPNQSSSALPSSDPADRSSIARDSWQFSHSGDNFFPLKSESGIRGVTIRLSNGEIKFIPMDLPSSK